MSSYDTWKLQAPEEPEAEENGCWNCRKCWTDLEKVYLCLSDYSGDASDVREVWADHEPCDEWEEC